MVYEAMKKAARTEGLLFYSDIGQMLAINMENPAERDKLAALLGEISEFEHSHDRPLLSALVVHKADAKPGAGFFKLARALKVCGKNEDEDKFHSAEVKRAYAVWK